MRRLLGMGAALSATVPLFEYVFSDFFPLPAPAPLPVPVPDDPSLFSAIMDILRRLHVEVANWLHVTVVGSWLGSMTVARR